ncbi:MAG: LysM peptidoglycan-binding domain-containing protein [Lutibacter sp.]|nr:LysM peptidoglycan-binding domain-containing protein [Lutibacter sp.]
MLLKSSIYKLTTVLFLLLNSVIFAQKTNKHTVEKGESISVIAKKYKVSIEDIYDANPSIKGKVLQLKTILTIPPRKDENGNIIIETHTVASGETLNGIANKYNLSTSKLTQLNPNLDARRLKIGQVLNLTEDSKNTNSIVSDKNSSKTHTISSGETLNVVAHKNGLTLAQLMDLNPDVDARKLKIGQVLQLSETATEKGTSNANNTSKVEKNHSVASGETFNSIAQKYGLTLQQIVTLNPNVDARKLRVGMDILVGTEENTLVKTDLNELENTKLVPKVHIISKGETLNMIAKKHNISLHKLEKLNPTIDSRKLKIGMVVNLPPDTIALNSISKDEEKAPVFKEVKVLSAPKTHRIKKGETLKILAHKYDLSLKEISKLNPALNPRNLRIGTIVKLNKPDSITILKRVNENGIAIDELDIDDVIHTVVENDTKYSIANKYGITYEELHDWNPEVEEKLIVGFDLVVKRGSKSIKELTPDLIEAKVNSESNAVIAEILIENASKYMGTPYRGGGTTARGFDCSGLMCTTFKEINMNLPRSSRSMVRHGAKINKSNAQKGDLIFFATGRKNIVSHVGLVTEVNEGDIKFIHSSTSQGVIISSLNEDYYSKRFIQINRVLE